MAAFESKAARLGATGAGALLGAILSWLIARRVKADYRDTIEEGERFLRFRGPTRKRSDD